MRFTPGVLNCSDHYPTSNRVSRFRYIQVDLSPSTNIQDENLLKHMFALAETLASQVTKNSANDASFVRSQERLIRNALAGLLSESAWRLAVNGLTKKETLSSTNFTHTYEQIDLVTDDNKTIEVRSSFPRKGLAFALCKQNQNVRTFHRTPISSWSEVSDDSPEFSTMDIVNSFLLGDVNE